MSLTKLLQKTRNTKNKYKKIGDAVIKLLITKKREAELRMAASWHERELNAAKEIWNIVEITLS